MEYLIVPVAALLASGLTLFSGFGLGTLLLPVFAIFFPIEIAVSLTAVVHLLNNIFKLFLVGKYAELKVAVKFGLPAVFGAFLGAGLLSLLAALTPVYSYDLFNKTNNIEIIKLIIACLILIFVIIEFIPSIEKMSFDRRLLPVGGIISGFFGGLSGHQGALRSAFLIKLNLTPQAFIATGVVIACVIDLTRLSVYSSTVFGRELVDNTSLIILAVLSAFLGAFAGSRLMKKITHKSVKLIVAIMLVLISLGLASGII